MCLERLLTFAAIADAPLNAITGETVSRYARHRQEVPKNSVVTVNGDLRTLRRILHLAVEWGKLDRVPAIHELPQPKGRDRVLSFRGRGAVSGEGFRESPRCNDSGGRYRDAPQQRIVPAAVGRCGLDGAPRIPAWSAFTFAKARRRAHSAAFRSLRALLRFYRGARRRQRRSRSNPRSCFRARAIRDTSSRCSIRTKTAIEDAKLETFEFYCWRHTFGTRAAQSGMDRFTLARLMGHSSPSVAARYYIHVTETHVAAGFGKFVEYQTRNVAEGIAAAFPQASEAVQ